MTGASPLVSKTVSLVPTSARKQRDYSYLKPYQFKPGHAAIRRADGTTGRPLGTKDALTVIAESAPIKARQYVKSKAPAVLVDARKWIMPIESDHQAPTLTLTRVEIVAELQRRGIVIPAEIPE